MYIRTAISSFSCGILGRPLATRRFILALIPSRTQSANRLRSSFFNHTHQLSLIPSEEESGKLLNLLSLVGTPVQGVLTKMDILRAPLIEEGRK